MRIADTEFDLLTGDHSLVLEKAKRYEELGRAIGRSVATLNSISEGDGQKSKAIDALKESASNVARDIGKAEERYALTATALIGYAGKLKTAQEDAGSAISAINSAQDEVSTAQTKSNVAETDAATPGPEQLANAKLATAAADTLTTSNQALATAHSLWRSARDDKDAAASAAASEIDDVVNGEVGGALNDSWWDDFNSSDFMAGLKTACAWAGVAAIFLSWVPILGPILIAVAVIGALVTLADASVKFSRGEGSFSSVVFAAVGVVLAAFGGKIVAYVAKLAKYKSAANLAKLKPGETGFKNSHRYKRVVGVTKTEVTDLSKFKGAMKEIGNPFDLKLGAGTKFSSKFLSGAETELGKFKEGMGLGLKLDSGKLPLTTGATVTLAVLNGRQIVSPIQTGLGMFGVDAPMKPESLLAAGSGAVESKLTG